jgi:hypothetical protein
VPKAKGWLRRFVDDTFPLYFQVSQTEVVVATNKNCDMVLEYITDVSKLEGNIPKGYPKPGRARFSSFLTFPELPAVLCSSDSDNRTEVKERRFAACKTCEM